MKSNAKSANAAANVSAPAQAVSKPERAEKIAITAILRQYEVASAKVGRIAARRRKAAEDKGIASRSSVKATVDQYPALADETADDRAAIKLVQMYESLDKALTKGGVSLLASLRAAEAVL